MPEIFIDYLPAELCENKEWYVKYYALKPSSSKLHIKKVKINKIKNIRERRRYGRKLVIEINKKLEGGWNPFIEQESSKSFTDIFEVFDIFIRVKTKELEVSSMRGYRSDKNILSKWLKKRVGSNRYYSISFTKNDANDFMNYMYIKRDVGERRYNGMLNFCHSLFSWMLSANYIKVNPFTGIKKKKTKTKKRKVIPANVRQDIKEYLIKTEERFLINLLIQFHALLRPKESLCIKVKDINVKRQTILVREDIAKNDNTRVVTISNSLLPWIIKLNLQNYDPELFVFSDKLLPGKNLKRTKHLGYKWGVMRKKMGFAEEYQMYSLRDTGIIQMLNDGISIEEVAKQADHHSLDITSKYALHANTSANEIVKTKSSDF